MIDSKIKSLSLDKNLKILEVFFNLISNFKEILNLFMLFSNSFHYTRRFLLVLWTYPESGLHLNTLHPVRARALNTYLLIVHRYQEASWCFRIGQKQK